MTCHGVLHIVQRYASPLVARSVNDTTGVREYRLHMSQPVRIHKDKSPPRKHFIREWMEHRGIRPRDVTEAFGVDKSVISRWLNENNVPSDKHLLSLAEFLHTTVDGLFRHPDDDWIRRIFEGRSRDEAESLKKAIQTITEAFDRKRA